MNLRNHRFFTGRSAAARHGGAGRAVARLSFFLLIASLSFLPASGRAEAPPPSTDRMRAHAEYLASDRLAGRLVGTAGIRRAEAYIAARFQEYGLQPVPGSRGYFLPFTLYRVGFDPQGTRLEGSAGGRRFTAEPGLDFRPLDETGAGMVEGEVVFAGYGITAPEHGWDDYRGLDVQGRLVLVLRHEPNEGDPAGPFDGRSFTDHALFSAKIRNARRHGAAGLLVVTDPLHHPGKEDLRLAPVLRLEPPAAKREEGGNGFPAAQVSQALAGRLLGGGERLEELQRAVDRGELPAALEEAPAPAAGGAILGAGEATARARLEVRLYTTAARVAARNVAGFLPGSDPQRRDEWLLVGAHHDHLGSFEGQGDTVYNGADDNASGTTAVLELARLFAAARPRPARSMLFVTYSAEEEGLLGSRAIVARRLLPLERLSFALNLDMIGRNPDEPIEVYGDRTARPLRPLLAEANRELDLPLQLFGSRVMEASDHATFQEQGIPFLAFFTGVHRDYHQVSDEPERLEYTRMARIVRLGERLLAALAARREPLHPLHEVGWLGMSYEAQGRGDALRLEVSDVSAGSPAAAAGLRPGDVLRSLGGRPLGGGEAEERFAAVKAGGAAVLGVERGAGRLELQVTRAVPGYLGIVPRPAGEGAGVRVDSAVGGGPAAGAGLRGGDVIEAIEGRPVGIDTLDGLLAQLGAGREVRLLVRRGGGTLTLPVTLGRRPDSR